MKGDVAKSLSGAKKEGFLKKKLFASLNGRILSNTGV